MSELDKEALEAAIEAVEVRHHPNPDTLQFTEMLQRHRAAETKAAINAYLASMAEKGFRMMPRTITGEMDACATDYYIPRPKSWTWEGVWKVMFDTFAAEQNPNQHGGGET